MQDDSTIAARPKLLSVVTTTYRSEPYLGEFVRRALAASAPLANRVEVVIVDDGSPDRSAELARDLADADDRVALVQLSRNFGHHKALLTGLEHAAGDLVFILDSDLEEPPESLLAMLAQLQSERADCVYGVQRARKGGWFEVVSGNLFYWLFGLLSEVQMPRNVSTMRLMTRRYVDSLLRFRDHNPVFVPLSLITGYRQTAFSFDKASKQESSYTLFKRISLLVLMVTSFSGRPLSLMFGASIVLAVLGLVYGIIVVIIGLNAHSEPGWPSLMAAIVFFFSLNALFTGVLGLYVKRIIEEVKDRPRTIVQEVYRQSPSPGREDGTP